MCVNDIYNQGKLLSVVYVRENLTKSSKLQINILYPQQYSTSITKIRKTRTQSQTKIRNTRTICSSCPTREKDVIP